MTPRWMAHLVRARQSQEDAATQRLSFARRSQARAHAHARAEKARLEAMGEQTSIIDAGAFVAAAVALQSVAATHAAAMGEAERADRWVVEREQDFTAAAVARQSAERLRDDAQNIEERHLARVTQLELDEIAAAAHQRRLDES